MEFDKSILLSFLTKSSSWRYENEWRLLLPVDGQQIKDKKTKIRRNDKDKEG